MIILNCAPPYTPLVPNAALGYLKGFLEAKGIRVKNVYWNLVLMRELLWFNKVLGEHSIPSGDQNVGLFVCKHLLEKDTASPNLTSLDRVFTSLFDEEEIRRVVESIKERIDSYIKKNRLHEDLPVVDELLPDKEVQEDEPHH
jgi:hypothetical protein